MPSTASPPLADTVRTAIARRGMSQAAAARALGWDRRVLNDRLQGRSRFTVADVQALAALLGVEVKDLLDPPQAEDIGA